MKDRMGFEEKRRRGLLGSESSRSKKTVGGSTLTTLVDQDLSDKTPSSNGIATIISDGLVGEQMERLSHQHGVTHSQQQQIIDKMEENFANMLKKFDNMRAENEMQRRKLLEEQKKTSKLALASAKAANKAAIGIVTQR